MKKIKILPLLVAFAALLSGCEKELEMEYIDSDPKVVVMSTVEAGVPVALQLTYSRFFLSTAPFRAIDNATVTLTVNGNAPALAATAEGNKYTVAYAPAEGDKLDLRVQVPGHDDVTASTVVPRRAVVTGMRVQAVANADEESYFSDYSLRFTLDDPAGERNYYRFQVIQICSSGTYRDTMYSSFSCNDYTLNNEVGVSTALDEVDGGARYSHLMFTDEVIDGMGHETELTVGCAPDAIKLILVVTTYSRDRYLYEVTEQMYEDDPYATLFSEPVQIHTNINGGIGIFGASARTSFSIDMP